MAVDLTNPCSFPGAFAYEHTDIPPGMTAIEWRRGTAAEARAAKAARKRRLVVFLTAARLRARLHGSTLHRAAGVARRARQRRNERVRQQARANLVATRSSCTAATAMSSYGPSHGR